MPHPETTRTIGTSATRISRGGGVLSDRGSARPALILLGLGIALLVVIAVVLFPVVLGGLGGPTRYWERLSFMAQVVAAGVGLISVLSLVGVIGALWTQMREYRAAREQAIRTEHRELLKMAMDRPKRHAVWGGPADPALRDDDDDMQTYAVMIVDFWQMAYTGGASTTAEVHLAARRFFTGRIGRAFWELARADRARAAGTRAERRFHAIVEEEYAAARRTPPEPDAPSAPTPGPGAPAPARPCARAGTAAGMAVAFGAAGAVAGFLLGRRRRAGR